MRAEGEFSSKYGSNDNKYNNFHSCTVHLDAIKFIYQLMHNR